MGEAEEDGPNAGRRQGRRKRRDLGDEIDAMRSNIAVLMGKVKKLMSA